jgi:hypothetical protein
MVDASLVIMSSPDLIVRFVITFVFGGIIALLIAWGIGFLFPDIRITAFLVMLVLWFVAGVQALKQREGDETRDTSTSRKVTWNRATLPTEFQFADQTTTFNEIEIRVGPHTRSRENQDGTRIMEWDLPYGTIFISFGHSGNHALVRNIRYFRTGQRGEELS